MAEVELRGVAGGARPGWPGIADLSLDVPDGQVLAVLGPSGSGKTTLLRLVAGLEPLQAGEILLGGEPVGDVPAHRRDLAMLTEEHPLLGHLNVERNIGFPLHLRRLARSEVARRARAQGRALGLGRLLRRRPATLSAGERQLASLARATVRLPAAYLLDEPLTRIDARERDRLRAELARQVRGLGVTTLLATNDQRDALTLADRIAVLRDGRLQQLGTAEQLYRQPVNVFVATFVGDPGMSVLAGQLECGTHTTFVRFAAGSVPLVGVPAATRRRYDGAPILLGARPEDLALASSGEPEALPAVIERVENLGAEARVAVRVAGLSGEQRAIVRLRPGARLPAAGARAGLTLRAARHRLFDPTSGEALP